MLPGLVGLTAEFGIIRSLLDDVAGGGRTLLVHGGQDTGRTALLDAAQVAASSMGMRVLRVNGAAFEADIALAGLQQLLLPLSGDVGALPDRVRRPIEAALDLGVGHTSDRPVILNAVFALLRAVAERTPTMLIVDDVQWFDQASAEVLAFVARRLAGIRVGLLVATREGSDNLLSRVGLPAMRLRPLLRDVTTHPRRPIPTIVRGFGRTVTEDGEPVPGMGSCSTPTIAPRADSADTRPRDGSRNHHRGPAAEALVHVGRAGPELRAATAMATDLLYQHGAVDDAHVMLVTAIDLSWNRPDADPADVVEALDLLAEVCHYGSRTELWAPFRRALQRLGENAPPALRLVARICPDPLAVSAADLLELDQHVAGLRQGDPDPMRTVRIGMAAHVVDRLPGCREALRHVFRGGRENGRSTCVVRAGLLLALDAVDAGRWTEAQRLADDCISLCGTTGQQLLAWSARHVTALVAAGQGHWNHCGALTDEMLEWASPRGAHRLIRDAQHARCLAFSGQGASAIRDEHDPSSLRAAVVTSLNADGRGAACTRALQTISAPTASAHSGWPRRDDHYVVRHGWDLVEAAVRAGRPNAADEHVRVLTIADTARISPRLALQRAGAEALVAADDNADRLFRAALEIPGVEQWPFEVARIQLAFGERLRRRQATRASREQLAAALEVFTRLGARPWAERAGAELKATGQTRHRAEGNNPAPLTPQELEIAEFAATGLTNKEIGARMYVSPRTVSAHLYRIFPKLGITSRAALRDALIALASPS